MTRWMRSPRLSIGVLCGTGFLIMQPWARRTEGRTWWNVRHLQAPPDLETELLAGILGFLNKGPKCSTSRAIHKVPTWTVTTADALKMVRCQWRAKRRKCNISSHFAHKLTGQRECWVYKGWSTCTTVGQRPDRGNQHAEKVSSIERWSNTR
ncbi:hypothetical protein DFJ58DRAFT_84712 [Suillus subalutaceus]|uniref:uncharacterized protein n=1 Tax=Suillus subalutaceus TaxID=48586 RepID=UPI001B86A5A8|nr:uncharacterized protein DFJ58DRAFT_84712 [Suillus subalutaceus]KAG1840911.1 hypothetical protein DFJ58DRAFT_84712 [Suillus subalutaceus]